MFIAYCILALVFVSIGKMVFSVLRYLIVAIHEFIARQGPIGSDTADKTVLPALAPGLSVSVCWRQSSRLASDLRGLSPRHLYASPLQVRESLLPAFRTI